MQITSRLSGFGLVLMQISISFLAFVDSQAPIPAKFDGFWYGNRAAGLTDSIFMEAFLDPVCPDSRDSWPPLKQALQHYGSRLSLVVHPFPLPYHDNAFLCSRALHIINKLNASATYTLLESFFNHQEKFYGEATFNKSRAYAIDQVLEFATQIIGKPYGARVKIGFSDPKTDRAARISFKYGCSRGVYGTPFFFVNGFALPETGPTRDYSGWRSIIDPLLKEGNRKREAFSRLFL